MGECPGCGRDLPEAGYLFCPWCAAPLAMRSASQRKNVTVVFADLVDSTRLGSSLDPEVLRSVVASYWGAARSAIEQHGGRVAKFIGDAAVGVFGIPAAYEDDALRAVRAAVDLRHGVEALNADLETRLGIRLSIRIGVNTGPIMIDGLDDDVSLLAGDVANVCARLEQAAEPGDILLGEATFVLVRDGVVAEPVEPIIAKGKDDPVPAFRLTHAQAVTDPVSRRRFVSPLVGRDLEMALARSAFDAAVAESECTLVTVVGTPGVGKSRLVAELLSQVSSQALVLQGRCLPYGDGITYWPVVQMLQPLLTPEGPAWARRLGEVDHQAEIAEGLDSIMGSSSAVGGGHMAWAFRRLLETLARTQPVIIVVDDVQWAEPALVDLLDHLLDFSRAAPILVVCMARPEFLEARPAWHADRPRFVAIELAALSPGESSSLARCLLGSDVDTAVLDRIASSTDGVPLFIEEVVASLVDQGFVKTDASGEWRASIDLDEVQIPPSVQALMTARLDRLPSTARRVIDAASVIGQTFYPDAIRAQGRSAADVMQGIAELVQTDLIAPTASDVAEHDAYSFRHLLIRDVAYEGIPKARRAEEHEAFARWLDSTVVASRAPEVVASHLERAAVYRDELGDHDPALSEEAAIRLSGCADRARLIGDLPSADALLAAAEALVPVDSPLGMAAAVTRVDVGLMRGDYAWALDQANRIEALAQSTGDLRTLWRSRLLSGWLNRQTDPAFDMHAAGVVAEAAIRELGAIGDDAGVAGGYYALCNNHVTLGRFDELSAAARMGLAAARRGGDLVLVGRLLEGVLTQFWLGNGTLLEEERVVAELVAEFGDEPLLARDMATYQAILRSDQGHVAEAVNYATLQRDLAREQQNSYLAIDFQLMISYALLASGDLAGAEESLSAGTDLGLASGETSMQSTRLAELAFVLARQGRDDEARATMVKCRAISQPSDVVNEIFLAIADGLVLAHEGKGEASEERFADGLDLLAETQFAPDYGHLWIARSAAREALGDASGALTCAREALAVAQSRGHVPPLRVARERVAECAALVAAG